MRALFPVWRAWRLFILHWALRELDPLHPDVPDIVRELHTLEDSRV
jgi:hypothetical protein